MPSPNSAKEVSMSRRAGTGAPVEKMDITNNEEWKRGSEPSETQEPVEKQESGFWTPTRNVKVFASEACFGFRGRLWETGEMTVVSPGETVPRHFKPVSGMGVVDESPMDSPIAPSAYNANYLKG